MMMAMKLMRRMMRDGKRSGSAKSTPPKARVIFDIEGLETRRLFTAYTLSQYYSTLTMSGTVNGAPVTAQYSGGLTDAFNGTVQVNIVGIALTFPDGNTVTGVSSGSADPGAAAANYAGAYSGINFAIRNLSFNVSGGITLGAMGYFTGTATTTVPAGAEIDFDVAGNTVSKSIAGLLTTNPTANFSGSARDIDGSVNLTVPIHEVLDQTINGVPVDLDFDGEMLMSGTPVVTATLSGTTLTIIGTPAGDNVSVSNNSGEINVAIVAQNTQSFPAADVSLVSVVAGLGADQITIGAGVPASIVIGGLGEDDLTAANSANDILAGGGGEDHISIDGSSGNDLLKGGLGPDTLAVDSGTGNNTLTGGTGFDELHGGSGENLLAGGAGGDTIYGGTGFETLDGGLGTNDIMPGANDSVVGS